jgi:hypothetical protein
MSQQLLFVFSLTERATQALALARELDPDLRLGAHGDTSTVSDATRILNAHLTADLCEYPPCRAWVATHCDLVESAWKNPPHRSAR